MGCCASVIVANPAGIWGIINVRWKRRFQAAQTKLLVGVCGLRPETATDRQLSAIGSPTRTDFGRTRGRFARRGYLLSARNATQGQVSPVVLPESDIGEQYLEVGSR